MDTKTPPITLKFQEKSQPRKQERVADISLPPLNVKSNYRHNHKTSGTPWSCPGVKYQDHKKRQYRVLHIGATPLMHACQQGDRARVLRLLKEQEETVGYRDRTLRSALHYCMDAGTGGAVAAAAPELVNAPDAEGHTPLHLAVIAGDTQLVAVLLANGADVNAKDLEGHSVLHWATVCGEAECVRLVLAAGARPSTPDLRGGSPLHYAAQCCGAAATAELSVPKKVGLKVLQTLLEFGADVNAKDEDGRQPILWAASAGSVDAVLALARAGGSATAGASDKDGLTALHCAASRGHVKCIEALVNLCGSQPDHVDDNGCSALHYAATLGHADATALILKLGADPNRQDRKGRTPVLCAAAKGQLETLKILAQHSGSLHARTVRGTGVAHEAVASGRIELIKWLARKRPSTLDVTTQDGKTPLHVAALHGYLDACKILLDNGAKVNAVLRTSKGNLMTALDAALYRGHRDCAKLIQMHGGTTVQQLRAHNTVPSKVFVSKFRITPTEGSTDTESSPRSHRRRHADKHPELYYEEQWIERRTRRRGNTRKLTRRDSRSFSEEEIHLSKTSSKNNQQRRTRSESTRCDDEEKTNRRLRRRRSKKQLSKCKFYYSESSTEADSVDRPQDLEENGSFARLLHRKLQKRNSKSKSRMEKHTTDTQDKDESYESEEDDCSLSDDSLEVIVMKKSLQKTCEKIVSERKSKTPVGSSKETKVTRRKKHSSNKKSKTGKMSHSGVTTEISDQVQSSEERKEVNVDEIIPKNSRISTNITDVNKNDDNVLENQYRPDITDSTSQETVERVVVTAIVHEGQTPDTPKSVLEVSKNVDLKDDTKEGAHVRNITAESSAKTKMNDIFEKADEVSDTSVEKTTESKRKAEAIQPQNNQMRTQETEKDSSVELEITQESKMGEKTEKDASMEGEPDADTRAKDDSLSMKLHLGLQQPGRHEEDDSSSKSVDTSSSRPPTQQHHHQQVSENLNLVSKDSLLEEEERGDVKSTSQIDRTEHEVHTTPRTIIQDISASDAEDAKKTDFKVVQSTSGRSESGRSSVAKTPQSRDGSASSKRRKTSKTSKDISKKRSESTSLHVPHGSSCQQKADDLNTEGYEQVHESQLLVTHELERTTRSSPDDKEQADSARGRSLDLSSESRNSVLMDEEGGESIRIETPVVMKASDIEPETEEVLDLNAHKTRSTVIDETASLKEEEDLRYVDENSLVSSKPLKSDGHPIRPLTGKLRKYASKGLAQSASGKALFESSEDYSEDRSAIVAVIESPEWDEDDDEVEKEIRDAIGDNMEEDTEHEEDTEMGVMRVLPSTSEEETVRVPQEKSCRSTFPEVPSKSRGQLSVIHSPVENRQQMKQQRRDSGGRDSGIEPSPRVSRIPKRRITKCCPNTKKQQALNMDTITRDVQISLRRYHLERKIFFQLMELKRLQIRHGRANEHVLVKRQVRISP